MAARDGASSVQGVALRATRLNLDGSIDDGFPVFTTKGFLTASFASEYEEGDEITEKAADGSVCISWKADDSLTRLTFSLSLCSPDPEAAAILAGGEVICAASADVEAGVAVGEIIGYTSPPVGSVAGNPVAVEIWSIANVGGKPTAGTPFWHWAFPYVKIRYEGDREFTNGALANEFTGQALGNSALVAEGLNPAVADPATQDFVLYKCSLVNPFSYVRTKAMPSIFGMSGPWEAGCEDCVTVAATTVTPGTPGSFQPSGSDAPANLTAIQGGGALGETAAWTSGQYVVLGDNSHAHWDGDSWAGGNAP